MVTTLELIRSIKGRSLMELACLSTDIKPTDVANGSICIEMDTGKIFMFDEISSSWLDLTEDE